MAREQAVDVLEPSVAVVTAVGHAVQKEAWLYSAAARGRLWEPTKIHYTCYPVAKQD